MGDVAKLEHPHKSSVFKEVRFPSANTLYDFVKLSEKMFTLLLIQYFISIKKYLQVSLFFHFAIAMNTQCHICKWFLFADTSNTS
jgi:hypothetical protein